MMSEIIYLLKYLIEISMCVTIEQMVKPTTAAGPMYDCANECHNWVCYVIIHYQTLTD